MNPILGIDFGAARIGIAISDELQLLAHPLETISGGKNATARITEIVRENFSLTPKGIIEALDLRKPVYKATAAYGHFGRTGAGFTWERTDRADALRKAGVAAEAVTRR